MKEKVSIIVPTYNVEQYLNKCVDSLIGQTYENIEIFLVDDGATDNSGKICDELSKKDKRIKVIHKENGGYGSVLEYSIKNIESEFFLICDPDDWLELDAIEKLISSQKKYNADLVVGRKKIVYSDEKNESDLNDFKILKENQLYNNLNVFLVIPCSPHSKLYKTKLCKDIRFPKKINNTDYLLYHAYLTNISTAVYLNDELANYYIDRPGNSFNEDIKFTEKSLKSNAIVTEETYKQLNKKSDLYEFSVINLFIRSCKYMSLMKKYKLDNLEYKKIFDNIIENSKKYKNRLYSVLKISADSKIKCIIKYILYKMCFNKKLRKLSISILSKISKA